MRELCNFKYDKIGSFKDVNPFTIAFVYPKDDRPFVLKGGLNDVKKVIEEISVPVIIHITFWRYGRSRRNILIKNLRKKRIYFNTFTKNNIREYGKPYILYYFDDHKINIIKKFRRIPRKWIKELDVFCK